MTLHLTRDEWEQIAALGSDVLFREGEWCSCDSERSTDAHGGHTHPPAEFVEAAQPCETCGGTNCTDPRMDLPYGVTCRNPNHACPDCLGGKRRVAVVVPCEPVCSKCQRPRSNWDSACHCGWTIEGQPPLTRQRTVGHVVVTWGPLVVLPANEPLGADDGNWLEVFGTALIRYQDHDQAELVRPDVAPQSLVGQYAIGVEVVEP